jgi:hypothetical protein
MEIEEKKSSVKKVERYTVESCVPENPTVTYQSIFSLCFDTIFFCFLLIQKTQSKRIIENYMQDLNKELDVVMGQVNTDLDGRFCKVRTGETSLGT